MPGAMDKTMEPLGWAHHVREIGNTPQSFQVIASDTEREDLCRALDVPVCHVLQANYGLVALDRGRWRARGTVTAHLEQVSVVSLEPVKAVIEETFDVEFRPPEQFAAQVEVVVDDPELDDPEPIEDGRIRIGRLVFEILAASLDPYPRNDDEAFDPRLLEDDGTADDAGPFAALRTWKAQR